MFYSISVPRLSREAIAKYKQNPNKSHTKLYPNLEDAKAKIGKPHYWILNAVDEYEESGGQEEAMIALAILVFKSNYYCR